MVPTMEYDVLVTQHIFCAFFFILKAQCKHIIHDDCYLHPPSVVCQTNHKPLGQPNITTIILTILIYQILRVSVHCIEHGKHQINILSQVKQIALFMSKCALHFFSRIYKWLLQKPLHFQTLVILVNLVTSQFPFVFSCSPPHPFHLLFLSSSASLFPSSSSPSPTLSLFLLKCFRET